MTPRHQLGVTTLGVTPQHQLGVTTVCVLRRKQQWAQEKKRRRKEARQEYREKKLKELHEVRASMSEEELSKWREEQAEKAKHRMQQLKEKKERLEQGMKEGQRILIDMDFAEYMSEKEMKSIVQQLSYCYGANARASICCHLMLTGVDGAVKQALAKQIPSYQNWMATVSPLCFTDFLKEEKDKLVYLTADSDNEIHELDANKVYIVGGLVDRNRHKGLCLNKAKTHGIQTARLPIGEYVQLASSKVMCTNHVVEILIKWCEVKDWEQAFTSVIPIRKRKAVDT